MVITYVCVFVGVKGGALLSVMYDYSRHRDPVDRDPAIRSLLVYNCLRSVGVVRVWLWVELTSKLWSRDMGGMTG